MQMTWRKALGAATLAIAMTAGGASSCEDGEAEPQGKEDTSRQSNYERLVESQPAATMDYSPSRDTKNFWINTWDEKGKLSYVYLLSGGKPWAYAVIKRLPVSYCTSLVPPVRQWGVDHGDYGGTVLGPAPSIDGTFGSSANCSTMYGEDATTGAYVEWTVGADTTMLLRDQPLPLNLYEDALPLGDTSPRQAEDLAPAQ